MDALYISLAVTLMFSGLIAWGWLGWLGYKTVARALRRYENEFETTVRQG